MKLLYFVKNLKTIKILPYLNKYKKTNLKN